MIEFNFVSKVIYFRFVNEPRNKALYDRNYTKVLKKSSRKLMAYFLILIGNLFNKIFNHLFVLIEAICKQLCFFFNYYSLIKL